MSEIQEISARMVAGLAEQKEKALRAFLQTIHPWERGLVRIEEHPVQFRPIHPLDHHNYQTEAVQRLHFRIGTFEEAGGFWAVLGRTIAVNKELLWKQ